MSRKAADLSLGASAEKQLLPVFKEKIDPDLRQTSWSYDSIDFESAKTIIELKTRNYKYCDLKDLMIGANKVKRVSDEWAKNKRNGYLVFNCLDGVFYWKFNPEEFDEMVTYRDGGRNDRGYDERKLCAYIGKKHMKCLIKKDLPIPVF